MPYTVRAAPPGKELYMIGCAPLAVDSAAWAPGGWQAVSDAGADEAIAAALRAGLTKFDYKPEGRNMLLSVAETPSSCHRDLS
jgi:hypothetical protein